MSLLSPTSNDVSQRRIDEEGSHQIHSSQGKESIATEKRLHFYFSSRTKKTVSNVRAFQLLPLLHSFLLTPVNFSLFACVVQGVDPVGVCHTHIDKYTSVCMHIAHTHVHVYVYILVYIHP